MVAIEGTIYCRKRKQPKNIPIGIPVTKIDSDLTSKMKKRAAPTAPAITPITTNAFFQNGELENNLSTTAASFLSGIRARRNTSLPNKKMTKKPKPIIPTSSSKPYLGAYIAQPIEVTIADIKKLNINLHISLTLIE